MEYLDIETFRCKYSDITVTAVPNTKQHNANDANTASGATKPPKPSHPPCVEITRIPLSAPKIASFGAARPGKLPYTSSGPSPQQKLATDAVAYANEYKQLQLMSASGGGPPVLSLEGNIFGLGPTTPVPMGGIILEPNANIANKYNDLLTIIAGMPSNLAPSAMGLRAPKERLLRDIAHARVILRQCLILLSRESEDKSEPSHPTLY
ncbi:cyclin-dependent kinase 2-associated protein 2 isoform X2 [Scaptodrosophila lebanonensis]|uniref:Cyclin-dependent kinase 2-associated protein 2 isoform X2 n=1 Tax=Drosophila lebanonensis TaxID=7225 RepID=A0A6J2TAW3_DROLE|nr:cyclin-dependent kinase 2-associated protein 2 isoform X2 [Scaptodrosophila lebanonensis]